MSLHETLGLCCELCKLVELKELYTFVSAFVNYELLIGHGLKDVFQMRFDF